MQTPFVPAIVTPFKKGSLEVDEENFKSYLKYLWDAGYQDIVVNGSTGEFPSMTLDEREQVAEVARSSWPGRQFVNISSCNVEDSLRLLRHSQQAKEHLKGDRCIADGVLLLPPYYFAASTSEGLYNFFAAVIKEAKVPVYLYNFPANTGSLISADLYGKLAKEFSQLKGIKNTFDDLPLSKTFKEKAPHAQVMVGHDPSVLASLQAGLDGAIAATGSVLPSELLRIASDHKAGDSTSAEQHLKKLNEWNDGVASRGISPFSAVKAGLNHLIPGFPIDVRPPLKAVSQEELDFLQGLLK